MRAALDLLGGRPGGARPGDGRRKRRAAARRPMRAGAGGPAARGDRRHAQPAGGARARREAQAGDAATTAGGAGARRSARSGRRYVVVTGGHAEGAEAVDLFCDGERAVDDSRARGIPAASAHGSGCTHSAALAAHLALGLRPARGGAWRPSGSPRRPFATGCSDIGAGPGPVDALGIGRRRPDARSRALHRPAVGRRDRPLA